MRECLKRTCRHRDWHLARRRHARLCAAFSVDAREIVAEIKSGVACYPDDGHEAHELVQNAEAASRKRRLRANAICITASR